MEFLDKIVLPQSSEHIQLLHYLLILIQFIFLPFISVVLVGTFISLRYWKKGLNEKSQIFLRFSKEIINAFTINKSSGIILGIIPVLTSILIYAQLFHNSSSSTLILLLSAFPLITIGLILIYGYKYSLNFTELFRDLENASPLEKKLKERVVKYELVSKDAARKSGISGFTFLLAGSWIYISAISSAVFSEDWMTKSQISILISIPSLVNFLQFILLAFAITGSAILFAFFYWEGGKENLTEEYKNFVKKVSLTIAFTALILLPVILFINILLLPKSSLSGSVFSYSVIAVVLIFLSYHFLYAISKTSNLKMSGQLFFVVIFAFLSLIIKDQMAMSNSTKLHSAVLSADFDKYLSELKGEGAVVVKARSGEEIFTIVCSSCHKFDEKLVGPPYNQVLTKYEGKMDQLIAFIRNPVKVDPAYPPMPNFALKLDEAKNIAEYLMSQHLKAAAPK